MKEEAIFGKPSCKIEGCPEHGCDNIDEYVRETKGVYKMHQTVCENKLMHVCDCEYCDGDVNEKCNTYISWRLFDQIDEILSGDGSSPFIRTLIENKKILPHEAYLRLFE